jgi:uncharacterized membrane protein YdfJ with MMPL/SSD domain
MLADRSQNPAAQTPTTSQAHNTTLFVALYLLALVLTVARGSILYSFLVLATVTLFWVGGLHALTSAIPRIYGEL